MFSFLKKEKYFRKILIKQKVHYLENRKKTSVKNNVKTFRPPVLWLLTRGFYIPTPTKQ